jgi:hypothetical protein
VLRAIARLAPPRSPDTRIGANRIDEEFWHRRGVDVLVTSLEDYIAGLRARVERFQPSGVG